MLHSPAIRDPIKQIQDEPDVRHWKGSHVLVSPIDWRSRAPHAPVALEDGVAGRFSESFKRRDRIPKRDHRYLEALLFEHRPEMIDLTTFSGTIDSREAYQPTHVRALAHPCISSTIRIPIRADSDCPSIRLRQFQSRCPRRREFLC